MSRPTPESVKHIEWSHSVLSHKLYNTPNYRLKLDNGLTVSFKVERMYYGGVSPSYGKNVQIKRGRKLLAVIGFGQAHSMAWFRRVNITPTDRKVIQKFAKANGIDLRKLSYRSDRLGTVVHQQLTTRNGYWSTLKANHALTQIGYWELPDGVNRHDWDSAKRYHYVAPLMGVPYAGQPE